MIFTDRTIIVQKGTSSINDTIILYRGDKGVEIRFTLNEGSPFKFGSGASPNIIEKTEAAYGQLIIKRPNDLPAVFSEIAPTNKGKIVFTITGEMIDEITEVGYYTFQLRLFDENQQSRATIPEVINGIEIREPIATDNVSTTNEVGAATVGYALTTAGTAEDTFDAQGNYNKTPWATGDRITAVKLNKIEAGIDGVNKKVASGGTGSNNAGDISITDTANNFTSTNVEDALAEAGSQIKDIENNIQNIGQPTDEQVANVINEAIANGEIVAGGITTTAQTLLISILRNATYINVQSANIDALATALASSSSSGGTETTQYTITNSLSNATSSNTTELVNANASYSATITASDGYVLDAITVTMGGMDISNTAVSGSNISISSVTGNIVITAIATEVVSGGPYVYNLADIATKTIENTSAYEAAYYDVGNSDAGGYGNNNGYTTYVVENIKQGDIIITENGSNSVSTTNIGKTIVYIDGTSVKEVSVSSAEKTNQGNYTWATHTFTIAQDYPKVYVLFYPKADAEDAVNFIPTLTTNTAR